jgi:hypothetical protein
MCNPLAIALGSTVLNVGSNTMKYAAESNYAVDQKLYQANQVTAQNQFMAENAALANQSYFNQTALAGLRIQQESESTAQQIQQEDIQARKAQATALVAGAEAGVSGVSLDSLLYDYNRQKAQNINIHNKNLEYMINQTEEEMKGYQAEALGRISSARPYIPTPVNTPSTSSFLLNTTIDAGKTFYGTFTSVGGKIPTPQPKPSPKPAPVPKTEKL